MIHLDPTTRTISGPRGTQRLSRVEWSITRAVIHAAPHVVSRDDLMPPTVWGSSGRDNRHGMFKVTLHRLRERLRLVGVPLDAIATVRRYGLRWTQ